MAPEKFNLDVPEAVPEAVSTKISEYKNLTTDKVKSAIVAGLEYLIKDGFMDNFREDPISALRESVGENKVLEHLNKLGFPCDEAAKLLVESQIGIPTVIKSIDQNTYPVPDFIMALHRRGIKEGFIVNELFANHKEEDVKSWLQTAGWKYEFSETTPSDIAKFDRYLTDEEFYLIHEAWENNPDFSLQNIINLTLDISETSLPSFMENYQKKAYELGLNKPIY